jgi:hypothetical protein
MRRNLGVAFFAVISFLIINSCATTRLTHVWEDSTYSGGPLRKVMVIGVFRQESERRYFEDELTRQLKARGTDAVQGYKVLPEDEIPDGRLPTRQEVVSKMKELGIDSALITRLVDVNDVEAYETFPPVMRVEGFYGYYALCCQYMVTLQYNVVLDSKIFETRNDKLIWSASSRTVIEGSLDNTLGSFIPAIISNLQEKKLIK